MATTAVLQLLTLTLIATSAANAAAAAAASDFAPIMAPSWPPTFQNTSLIAAILSTLGFEDLATASSAAGLSGAVPVTIFAPTDSSLLTCPTCSLPLLLQEHSLPGLYPTRFLRMLAFGTKIESLSAGRCLTVTTSAPETDEKVFVNGVEITMPDLFDNGVYIVHGLRGFVSHLSPLSCVVQTMTSLSFPDLPPPVASFTAMRQMLNEAMARLRVSGYSVASLAMRVRYSDLSGLRSMTLFVVDDDSIFMDGSSGEGGGGHMYLADLRLHIVPNRLLMAAELIKLPAGTVLPTLDRSRSLVVTSAGDGGPLSPTRINYVKVGRFDLVHNQRIVVHGLPKPFRHVDQ